MYHFGRISWYIAARPAPTRHVTKRQGCSCRWRATKTRCGVLPITSCEFTKKEKETVWECLDALLCAAFLQIISTGVGGGIVREEQGLIGPLPVFSLGRTPSSPACSARQPVRPIEQRDTHTHAPGPCHRAMPSPSKNEVTHTRRPNLVEPRLARPLPFLYPPTPICLPPPPSNPVRLPVATRSRETGSRVPNRHVGPCHPRATSRPALFPVVSPM